MGKMQQLQREFLYNKTFLQISLQNIYVFIKKQAKENPQLPATRVKNIIKETIKTK